MVGLFDGFWIHVPRLLFLSFSCFLVSLVLMA